MSSTLSPCPAFPSIRLPCKGPNASDALHNASRIIEAQLDRRPECIGNNPLCHWISGCRTFAPEYLKLVYHTTRQRALIYVKVLSAREVADQIRRVSFMGYDPGFFDEQGNRMEPVGYKPFAPKVLPMSLV
jgi:hypothetical protein